ncbi:hypothetical protein SAMN05660816_05494 [Niastella yeongjuensis]|nr:hypothetical protein SAMN05660816_05494 [Niastella yeongjuensis]
MFTFTRSSYFFSPIQNFTTFVYACTFDPRAAPQPNEYRDCPLLLCPIKFDAINLVLNMYFKSLQYRTYVY